MTRLKMKTIMSKPGFVDSASSKVSGVMSKVSKCTIKLKAVSAEDRQRLRIPSYKYLLP